MYVHISTKPTQSSNLQVETRFNRNLTPTVPDCLGKEVGKHLIWSQSQFQEQFVNLAKLIWRLDCFNLWAHVCYGLVIYLYLWYTIFVPVHISKFNFTIRQFAATYPQLLNP